MKRRSETPKPWNDSSSGVFLGFFGFGGSGGGGGGGGGGVGVGGGAGVSSLKNRTT